MQYRKKNHIFLPRRNKSYISDLRLGSMYTINPYLRVKFRVVLCRMFSIRCVLIEFAVQNMIQIFL